MGKSSLLNALDSDRRCTRRGERVRGGGTTTSRLYELDGIRIIDTPGTRWGCGGVARIGWFFPIWRLGVDCRFRDCSHTHEPDCAVTAAVGTGI